MDLDFVSVLKNAKRELGHHPAIFTSRLVNKIHVLARCKNVICACALSEIEKLVEVISSSMWYVLVRIGSKCMALAHVHFLTKS